MPEIVETDMHLYPNVSAVFSFKDFQEKHDNDVQIMSAKPTEKCFKAQTPK